MQKLGIYSSTNTTSSTAAFNVDFTISPSETALTTTGNIIIVGTTVNYASYVKYYNFMAVGVNDFSLYSHNACVLYESSNISGTVVTIDMQPITGLYTLRVTISPGSATTTKWGVYYKDFYY